MNSNEGNFGDRTMLDPKVISVECDQRLQRMFDMNKYSFIKLRSYVYWYLKSNLKQRTSARIDGVEDGEQLLRQ